MSRIGNIFILLLLCGAFWGAIYSVLFTLLALLVSGLEFQPQVIAATISGIVAAGALTIHPAQARGRNAKLLAAGVFVVGLVVLSGFKPLGLGLASYAFGQIVFIAIMTYFLITTLDMIGMGFGPGKEKRYNVEVVILRFLKSFGLVFFTIVLIGVTGFLFDYALRLLQSKILYWVPKGQGSLG